MKEHKQQSIAEDEQDRKEKMMENGLENLAYKTNWWVFPIVPSRSHETLTVNYSLGHGQRTQSLCCYFYLPPPGT